MKKICYLILLVCLSNCASFSKSDFKKEHKKLSGLKTINGSYSLQPSKSFGRYSTKVDHVDLYNEITNTTWKQKDNLSKMMYSKNKYSVKLDVIDNNFLSVKLYENTKLIKEEKLKGKLRKGMFYLDNKFRKCNGVPYLFGGCQKNKRRIGVTKSGQLMVNTTYKNGGAILIMFAVGGTYNTSYAFNKL